jgi:transcription elongation factor GreB
MSKAFTRESDAVEKDDEDQASPLPSGAKNYITPGGHARLKDEFQHLLKRERPEVTAVVSWAASNGDRSENGDYLYGKKRLREIDKRIRFLTKRLDIAEVVDPEMPRDEDMAEQIFFGATVTYANQAREENTVTIVGIDEIDLKRHHISWISPLARTLIKARVGDVVTLRAPGGVEELEIIDVRYEKVDVEPFFSTSVSFNASAAAQNVKTAKAWCRDS